MPGNKVNRIRRQLMDSRIFFPSVKYKDKVYVGIPDVIQNKKGIRVWNKIHGDVVSEVTDPVLVDYNKMESGFSPNPRLGKDFLTRVEQGRLSGTWGESSAEKNRQDRTFTDIEAKRLIRNYKPLSPRFTYPTHENINESRVNLKRDLNKTFHKLRFRERKLQKKGKDTSRIKEERRYLVDMAKGLGILGVSGVYIHED